jgi:hypothetical protein
MMNEREVVCDEKKTLPTGLNPVLTFFVFEENVFGKTNEYDTLYLHKPTIEYSLSTMSG